MYETRLRKPTYGHFDRGGLIQLPLGVKKEPFPTVTMAVMDITVNWPGAGPRNIEEQMVVRFEEAVKDVEDVKNIVSKATQGRAKVTITGKSRVNRRKFADDVREKINSVNGLPSDVERPIVTERINREAMIRVAFGGILTTAHFPNMPIRFAVKLQHYH